MRVFFEKDDFRATTHYILYTRAREEGGKKGGEGGRRGNKGNLAENRKAQWLGSTEKEKEGRKGGRKGEEERKGGGKEETKGGKGEGRKRREAKDKREIFSYVVGISLLLIP